MYTQSHTLDGGWFSSKTHKAKHKLKKRVKQLAAQAAATKDPVKKKQVLARTALLWRIRNLSKKDMAFAESNFNRGTVNEALLRKADYKTARRAKLKKRYGSGAWGRLKRYELSTRKMRHSKLAKFSPDWYYKYNARDKPREKYRRLRRELPFIKDPKAKAVALAKYHKLRKKAAKAQKKAAVMDAIGVTITTWGIGSAIGGLANVGKFGKLVGTGASFVINKARDKAVNSMISKGVQAEQAAAMAKMLDDFPPDPSLKDPVNIVADSLEKKQQAAARTATVKKILPVAAVGAVLFLT